MVKVITYGTYDLLHYGHIRLLEKAKQLGDYLIVGVTAEDFDKSRGKINVQQSLMERMEAVRATGIADEIIVEEYEGQKIDDIKRYNIDIFTVGSDWVGKFDYLREYCQVIYLERTEGISSSELREQNRRVRLGLVGDSEFLNKVAIESGYVNGLCLTGICTKHIDRMSDALRGLSLVTGNFKELLEGVDAIYIKSHPLESYSRIKMALEKGKHILCEAPMACSERECKELFANAEAKNLILMDAIKTAYATAYTRMLLLVKGGVIGKVVSVDAVCTSLQKFNVKNSAELEGRLSSFFEWGPTALLPVFQILGTEYRRKHISVHYLNAEKGYDDFVKIDFSYANAVASVKVGDGVKSEGELVITGTKGYVYVPAPWWKTDYFEVRYENPAENKRYFYQLEGEGIRYELVAFARAINRGNVDANISHAVTETVTDVIESFMKRENVYEIM